MKKNYFFTLLLTFCFSAISFGQIIITELADPNTGSDVTNGGANARFVEIYNVSENSVDMTGWSLRRWTNGNTTISSNVVDLSSLGNLSSGGFAIIAANGTKFQAFYGVSADISAGTGGPADSNGDDQIGLFNGETLIDMFGVVGEDGNANGGTCHEFEDGRAERKAGVSAAKSTWDESEWNVWADSTVATTCTTHSNSPKSLATDFDPGAWVGAVTSTEPSISIISPSNNQVFLASTIDISISFSILNFKLSGEVGDNETTDGTGDGYILGSLAENGIADGTKNIFSNSATINNVNPGSTYTITAELVDNNGDSFNPKLEATVTFSVELPCLLVLGDITTTCVNATTGQDTYDATIAFTGGNTGITYTIEYNNVGTLGGDNPDTSENGIITISGIPETTEFVFGVNGGEGSSCALTRTITSPNCYPLPLLETFSYAENQSLISNPLWVDASTSSPANDIQIIKNDDGGGNPIFTNFYGSNELPDPTGNFVRLKGKGSDPYIGFENQTSGTVYASFLMQVTDMTSFSSTNGGYFAVLADSNSGFRARVWLKDPVANEGLTYNLGISASGATTFHNGFTVNLAEPVFVVMSYDIDKDEVKLWVAPDATTLGTNTPAAAAVTLTGGTGDAINRFILRQDSTAETPQIDFDELRVGKSWADVTSTPVASVKNNQIDGFATYPNPVTNKRFTVSSNSSIQKQISIFNVLGKRVFSTSFSGTKSNVDVSSIASGLYILKVTEGDSISTSKLVIK